MFTLQDVDMGVVQPARPVIRHDRLYPQARPAFSLTRAGKGPNLGSAKGKGGLAHWNSPRYSQAVSWLTPLT